MENLRDRIEAGIKPLAESSGLELVEVKLAGVGSHTLVRVFVDKEKGVSIDECARLSSRISGYLEAEDLIPYRYKLEVSSPGLDRPLTTQADFRRKRGERVTLFMRDKADPRNQSQGIISSVEDENLVFARNGSEEKIPLAIIEKAIIAI